MAVDLRELRQRTQTADPHAPTTRERRVATGAVTPAATRLSGHSASATDRTERVNRVHDDPELRAIFDDAPPLPSSGHHVLGKSERAALDDFMARTHDGDAALMWEALSELARTSQTDMDLAKRLKNAMQGGKVDSKRAEMGTVESMNASERRSAGVTAGVSAATAAVAYGGYEYGKATGNQALGTTIGQMANNLMPAVGNYLNKVAGPGREVDKKKVHQMRHQMMQEVFEQGIENAKQNYDESRESMKLALKILSEHAERQTQITTTITRI